MTENKNTLPQTNEEIFETADMFQEKYQKRQATLDEFVTGQELFEATYEKFLGLDSYDEIDDLGGDFVRKKRTRTQSDII